MFWNFSIDPEHLTIHHQNTANANLICTALIVLVLPGLLLVDLADDHDGHALDIGRHEQLIGVVEYVSVLR